MSGTKINGWRETKDGNKTHYVGGVVHNDNGPAKINKDGVQSWFVNGYLHREDGPAILYADPSGTCLWYLRDRHLTVQAYMQHVNQDNLDARFVLQYPQMIKYATEETVARLDLRHVRTAYTTGVI